MLGIERIWRERERIFFQLRKLLRLRGSPHQIRRWATDSVRKQKELRRVDPLLDYLLRQLNLVREQLFHYYRQRYDALFRSAERLHEDGAQILAEELLSAIDKVNSGTSDAGFRAYFRFYQKRAFSRIIDLLEDRGIYIPRARRSKLRRLKRIDRRLYTLEGRNLSEEEISEITEVSSLEGLPELANVQRVDFFCEDEEGNCYERAVDDLTPEKLLLLKEELNERKREEKPAEENELSAMKIFWWNWDVCSRRSPTPPLGKGGNGSGSGVGLARRKAPISIPGERMAGEQTIMGSAGATDQ